MSSDQQRFEALADRLIGERADDQTKHNELAALMDRIGVPMMSAERYRQDAAIRALFASRGVTLLERQS